MSDRDAAATYEPDLFGLYLDEIGRYPLLSKEDEARLGKAVMAGQEARRILDSGVKLTARRRRSLEAKVAAGEEAARTFVNCNLRLVVSVARRYQKSGLPLADLVQEGNAGLVHAVEKFDWRKGFKFSTYAMWWIRQAISRGVDNTSRTVRLPSHVSDEARRIWHVGQQMEEDIGRPPSRAELAEETGMSQERLTELSRFDGALASLDMAVSDDGDATLSDFVADASSGDGFAAIESSDQVARLLDGLSERERDVVSRRFGLDGHRPCSATETGRALGVSGTTVKNIEKAALVKLRHAAGLRTKALPTAV